jgi:hypothetical protein
MDAYQIKKLFSQYKTEYLLLAITIVLLGIWAVKETIALRNILLACGSIISFLYIKNEIKKAEIREQLSFWNVLPLFFIALIFIWVLAHYFLLSVDVETQFKELTSTWLRSFLAVFVGLGASFALRKHRNFIIMLWTGIFISFIILFIQYIPLAFKLKKLLVPEYEQYLFHLKINVVITGMILITGTIGGYFDYMLANSKNKRLIKISTGIYTITTLLAVLWAFVFIVDARMGIGLSLIMICFWSVCIPVILYKEKKFKSYKVNFLFIIVPIVSLVLIFGYQQHLQNKGWSTLIDDIKIAVQIDRFSHWQNTAENPLPKNSSGVEVTGNNYVRVAWAVVGLKYIFENPMGVGVLSFPLDLSLGENNNKKNDSGEFRIATHSGWIELGLAFGIYILLMIFSVLIIVFINIVKNPSNYGRIIVMSFIVLITLLYSTGEAAIQHGLEMLFFFLGFLSGSPLLNISLTQLQCHIDK